MEPMLKADSGCRVICEITLHVRSPYMRVYMVILPYLCKYRIVLIRHTCLNKHASLFSTTLQTIIQLRNVVGSRPNKWFPCVEMGEESLQRRQSGDVSTGWLYHAYLGLPLPLALVILILSAYYLLPSPSARLFSVIRQQQAQLIEVSLSHVAYHCTVNRFFSVAHHVFDFHKYGHQTLLSPFMQVFGMSPVQDCDMNLWLSPADSHIVPLSVSQICQGDGCKE